MMAYNKFIVALVGVAIFLLKDKVGLDLSGQEGEIANLAISALIAAGVWAVPNKAAS